jgi:hypothetical protein
MAIAKGQNWPKRQTFKIVLQLMVKLVDLLLKSEQIIMRQETPPLVELMGMSILGESSCGKQSTLGGTSLIVWWISFNLNGIDFKGHGKFLAW